MLGIATNKDIIKLTDILDKVTTLVSTLQVDNIIYKQQVESLQVHLNLVTRNNKELVARVEALEYAKNLKDKQCQ